MGGVELPEPRYRPPIPMVIKEIPSKCSTCKTSAGFFPREISCKKFKNHLQLYVKIFQKKIFIFSREIPLQFFPKSHFLEYFSKSHRSSVILKILENFSNFSKI